MNDRSKDVAISKEVLPELPPEFKETLLGDRRGARKQYRSSTAHAREYEDKFTIHIDREDPRRNPLGHLLKDSPETIAAAATTLYFAKRSLEKGQLMARENHSGFSGLGLFSFLASFFFFNRVFGFLKRILCG